VLIPRFTRRSESGWFQEADLPDSAGTPVPSACRKLVSRLSSRAVVLTRDLLATTTLTRKLPSNWALHLRLAIAIMASVPPDHQQSNYPPPEGLPFNERQPPTIRLYPLSNYTFGTKETQPEEDPSVKDRLRRLEEHYEQHGMRRTCEAVLVCHEHNHPHVLMLQIANAFFKLYACALTCLLFFDALTGPQTG
jgi:hypothetical protein